MSKITCNLKTITFRVFAEICYSPTFGSAVTVILQTCSSLHSRRIAILRYVLFYFYLYSEAQNTKSADTEPFHGPWLLVIFFGQCSKW